MCRVLFVSVGVVQAQQRCAMGVAGKNHNNGQKGDEQKDILHGLTLSAAR